MIRAVLAVVVAAALLAASLPAVERARVDRTETALDRVPDRIERAAASLSADEPARRDGPGSPPTARRAVAVTLPRRSLVAAGVDYLALCPSLADRRGAVVVAAVDGAPVSRTRVAGRYELPSGGAVLATPGTHRLLLEPVERGGDRRVAVRRAVVGDGPSRNSSTETGPAGPCDSSTGSADGSRAATAGTTAGGPTTAAATRRSRPTPVRGH